MRSNRVYWSRFGMWHQIVWREGKMYLKCNHAVGHKTRRQISFDFSVTCKNCLRSKQ